jgi:hypothetical protein
VSRRKGKLGGPGYQSASRSTRQRRRGYIGTRRTMLLFAALLLVWVAPSQTRTTEVLRASPTVARPTQDLARQVLMQRRAPSQQVAKARSVRARLAELAASLEALERDPSSDRVVDVLARRRAADLAVASLRGPRSGRREGLPGDIGSRLNQIMEQVNAAAADPIGQRARLEAAREQIDAALAQPRSESGMASTLSVPNSNRVGP